MQRLVDMLAATPHRVIVSKGPQHELLQLADNMAGEEFLPQTTVLPQVELVLTHGGNNTTTESLYFGKPMVVLPLFWDQYDNAQRIDELGLGRRLAPYTCTEDELTDAIDALSADRALAARLEAISARVRSVPGTVRAADLIEQLATTGRPVTR
jgi:MGT family glycosyltransferase